MNNIITLTPINRSISKEQILDSLHYNPNDLIYVGGSLIEGFGNKLSDLDVFILTEDLKNDDIDATYEFKYCKVGFGRVNDVNLDIEYWSLLLLEDLFDKFNQIDFDQVDERVGNQLKVSASIYDISTIITRLINGVPVYNEEKVTNLINKLQINNYFRWMIRYYINRVDNNYEDIYGNIESGRYQVAVLIGREMLIDIMMAYLFSKRICIDRGKWIYPNLVKIAESDSQAKKVLNQYILHCYETALQKDGDYKANAENILRFTNLVASYIEKNIGGL